MRRHPDQLQKYEVKHIIIAAADKRKVCQMAKNTNIFCQMAKNANIFCQMAKNTNISVVSSR